MNNPPPKGEHRTGHGFLHDRLFSSARLFSAHHRFRVMFRKSQRTVKDYFLGDKNTSWIVISLSIVATETSTLTLIGVPALAYANYARPEQGGNFTYLQVVLATSSHALSSACFSFLRTFAATC